MRYLISFMEEGAEIFFYKSKINFLQVATNKQNMIIFHVDYNDGSYFNIMYGYG